MKIELIEELSLNDLQYRVSKFAEKEEVVSVSVSVYPMCDYYENRPQEVCNQWQQYIAVIIYKG